MSCRCRAVALLLALSAAAVAQDQAVPVDGPLRGFVHDPERRLLYITRASVSSAGFLLRYDLAAGSYLEPFRVGTELGALDITPEHDALLVAERHPAHGGPLLYRVALDSGAVTELSWPLATGEAGAADVAIGAHGKALVTAEHQSFGWVSLREIDLDTLAVAERPDVPGSFPFGLVIGGSRLERSADHSTLVLLEAEHAQGPAFTYDSEQDAFGAAVTLGEPDDTSFGAVSRDGAWIAFEDGAGGFGVTIYDAQLSVVAELDSTAGCLFDSRYDLFYGRALGDLKIRGAPAFEVLHGFDAAAVTSSTASGAGSMAMSDDGALLFLATSSEILVYADPAAPRVDGVEPPAGAWDDPAQPVRVLGDGFDLAPVTQVRFGDTVAEDVVLVDGETLDVVVPEGVPGPVEVVVTTDGGSSALAGGFAFRPAVLAEGDLVPGGELVLRTLVEPGDDVRLLWALPPAQVVSLPGYVFELCLAAPVDLVTVVDWPFDELTLGVALPDDPALVGFGFLLQALVAEDLAGAGGVFSNCATVTFGEG